MLVVLVWLWGSSYDVNGVTVVMRLWDGIVMMSVMLSCL